MVRKKKDKNKDAVHEECKNFNKRFNICHLVLAVIVIVFGIISYQIYFSLVTVPDMPEINLDMWWGPIVNKSQDESIRPYRVTFTDSMQENIHRKFNNYRSLTYVKSITENSTHGLNSETLANFIPNWLFKYKYKQRAQYLNKFDHFKTNIQGLDIHFVRVKPAVGPNIKVLPILLLHGFPTSIKEFYDVIPILTSTSPGYDFVFEVIVPSLPGFIYSQAPVRPGLSTYEMAIIMRNLMERLGFDQFYIHGGDIGHIIGSHIATIFPAQVLGFHTNFPVNFSKLAQYARIFGSLWPNSIEDENNKMYTIREKMEFYLEESGYFHLQSTKPDTIGIALQDSPVGLCAYIIDRLLTFTNPHNKHILDSSLSKFDSIDIIDNIMLYWSSGSITTAMRVFKEIIRNVDVEETLARIPTKVPTWGLRVKHELIHHSDLILSWKYRNLVGTTNLDVGGHFAAFEISKEVSHDIFRAVKTFIKENK